MNEHFSKVKALCNAARAYPAGATTASLEAWKRTYQQLPDLQENEVARCFNELCRMAEKQAA